MSSLDNGVIKLGVDLAAGGSIVYLASKKDNQNLINSYDWGRQVQMSFYSGPIPFEPNGKKPEPSWAGLGWNPIQSGDCFGHRSQVLDHRNDGKTIYVKCTPMQWPLDNEPGECMFETWISLEGNSAKIRSRLTNKRSDKGQYPARDQELPAVYTNGPWSRIISYTGDQPFSNRPTKELQASFPWARWQATESWSALINGKGEGLGVFHPGVTTFLGGFAGDKRAGGPKDFPTGYIAPIREEILDHNIVYDFEYFLIVGKVAQIRDFAYRKSRILSPPEYRFEKDRQHWTSQNATDQGWPVPGELRINLNQSDPQLIGPSCCWRASKDDSLIIEAALSSTSSEGRVYWTRSDSPNFQEPLSLPFRMIGDGAYRKYRVHLGSSPEYFGAITRFRLDPTEGGLPNSTIRIRSIKVAR